MKPIKNNVQHYEKVEIKTAKLSTKVIKSTNLNAFVTIIKYLLPILQALFIFLLYLKINITIDQKVQHAKCYCS